jgi:hypothetical protein
MMGLKKRDSCRNSFKEMEILPLCSQYIYSLMLHTVNNIHLFTRNTEVHNNDTRQNINLFLPSTSFTKVQKGDHYSGIKIFNHLPRELKQLSSDQKSFRFALKKFLYANPFYSLKEYFNYKCNKPEGRGFETRWDELFLLMYLILSAALSPGFVYSASSRNEYQKHKNNVSGE